jgi:hypothetical protein
MSELDDLIRYENENSSLDFKAVQYTKPMHEALIKDVMGLANAQVQGERYIIIGVKHRPDGNRDFLGIDEGDFIDSATYQQLIRDNIEPDLDIDYFPYRFDNILLGILKISGCINQPYMMRKPFGNLRAGDTFIRKGSHSSRLTRNDLDRIFARREAFSGTIRIGFDSPGLPTEITLPAIGDVELPSQRAAKQIQGILERRADAAHNPSFVGLGHLGIGDGVYNVFGGATSYEQRSTEQLRKDLVDVKEVYLDDDLYTMFEALAHKLQITFLNEGESYVEDVSVRLQIPRLKGLEIPNRIYRKPRTYNPGMGYVPFEISNLRYPNISEAVDYYEVTFDVGNVRHGIPCKAFEEPPRIVMNRHLVGRSIQILCSVYGRQLRRPRTETLTIHVSEPSLSTS